MMPPSSPAKRPSSARLFQSTAVRGLLAQLLVIILVVGAGWVLVANTLDNLAKRGIATGFSYLGREAGFDIGESLISYSAADSYWRALLVGLLNTLEVAVLGVLLASLLGLLVGLGRLSGNWLVRQLAGIYVESLRNVPVLLQLFVWYTLATSLPNARQALEPLPGLFLSNRGLMLPIPLWQDGGLIWDAPLLQGFNFSGGLTLGPEFLALLFGLSFYTAAFIAEIVRSGIQSVARGQSEAAQSLGLSRSQTLRLVILPQALRVIVPPLTSQYLNLTKNSTLAVAIGFPDLISVTNTTANQTGQVVESVSLMVAVFLCISLTLAGVMNWYNRKVALVSR